MENPFSRRDFIRASIAAGGVAGTARLSARRKVPVALEIYSVRREAQNDLPGTLAAIAKMGFEGIELAGFRGAIPECTTVYDRTAKELRKALDDAGLKMFSIHLLLSAFTPEQFERTVEFNEILGNRRLILGWLPPTKTIQPWYDHAKQIGDLVGKVRERKFRFGFHNHVGELDLIEGKRPFDVICDNTPKEVELQLHTASFPARGLDPVDYIRKYRGRCTTLHLNDHSPDTRRVLLGDGVIRWKELFEAAESVGGIETYFVEQESYPEPLTPMQCVERCLANFRKLRG